MILIDIIFWVWIFVLSVYDLKKRAVPRSGIYFGLGFALVMRGYLYIGGRMDLSGICLDLLPGVLFLLLALATQKVGYADGAVLLAIGLVLGFDHCAERLLLSLCISACLSVVLLLLKKVNGQTKLPFLPFLWVGFTICLIIQK